MKKFTIQLMRLSLALILLISSKSSFSQDVVVASAVKPVVKEEKIITEGDLAAAEEEDEKEPTFTLSGSLDTYFRTSFNTQNAYFNDSFAPSTSFANQHGFGLGMFNLIATYSGEKVGFTGDLVFGPRGRDAVFGTATNQGIINQAFVFYKVAEKFTLNLGQFNTFLGYEVISPTGNFHYSTSYLFSWGPFNHTGVRLDFAGENGVVAKFAVMNPTDFVEFNPVNTYTLGGQIGKTNDKGGIWFNLLYGDLDGTLDDDAVALATSKGSLFQADLTLGYSLTDKFYLGFNASSQSLAPGEEVDINGDIIDSTKDPSSFFGFAIYPKLTFSEKFALGLRAEYFSVKNGHLSIFSTNSEGDGDIMEFTLSGNYKVGGLTLIPEFRIDTSSGDSFYVDNEVKSFMPSLMLAAVYKF